MLHRLQGRWREDNAPTQRDHAPRPSVRLSSRVAARPIWGLATALLLLSAGACKDNNNPASAVTVRQVNSVTVSPAAGTVEVGATLALTASVNVTGDMSTTVSWESDAPSIATVSTGGIVTGLAAGAAKVTARSVADPSKFGAAAITVTSGVVKEVLVEPNPLTIVRGTTYKLTVRARNAAGGDVAGRPVAWSSENASIVAVSADGTITGIGFGTVVVRATIDGVNGAGTITVGVGPVSRVTIDPGNISVALGTTASLDANPYDEMGNEVKNVDVTWTSSDPSIASVDNLGVVTGHALGTVTITARAHGIEGSATVTILSGSPASIVISPRPSSLIDGTSVQLQAVVKDAGNNVLAVPVTWHSTDANIASVSASGLLVGVTASASPVRIIASAGTSPVVADTLVLAVTHGAAASMTVTLDAGQIEIGEKTLAHATVYDVHGHALSGQAVAWSAAAPGIATIDGSGQITGTAHGTTAIRATSGSLSAGATLSVVPAAVSSMQIRPPVLPVRVGETLGMAVVLYDKRGAVLGGRTITWSSSDGAVATVANGSVTGMAPGTAVVQAACEGKLAVATVTVAYSSLPVASVVVSLQNSTIPIGQTTLATATLYDEDGFQIVGRPIAWTTTNAAVATVANGVVTGVAAGPATIQATSEGITGGAGLTVIVPTPHILVNVTTTGNHIPSHFSVSYWAPGSWFPITRDVDPNGTLDIVAPTRNGTHVVLLNHPFNCSASGPDMRWLSFGSAWTISTTFNVTCF